MSKTIFQKIIDSEIPSYKVWEDDAYFAFLDIYPIAAGHVLVVPKSPNPYIFDMEDEAYIGLLKASKTVAKLLKSRLGCERIGVIVEGFGVENHVHVHLVPINKPGDLDITKARQATPSELAKTLEKITLIK